MVRLRLNGTVDNRAPDEIAKSERFGVWLEEQFQGRRWNTSEAARRTGVRYSTLRQYLAGDYAPKPDNVAKIAAGLSVPEASVWQAMERETPGYATTETVERKRLRQLVSQVRDERVRYAVELLEVFIRADDASGESERSSDAPSEDAG